MAKKESLADRLSALNKSWKKAEPRHAGAPLPPGDYIFRIDGATIEESKAGNLQVKWALTVVDGDLEGKKVNRWSGIETEDGLSFLQGDLELLEVNIPDSVDDLGDSLEETQGLCVQGAAVKNDEYINIYFRDLVESVEETDKEDKKNKDKNKEEKAEEEEEEEEKPSAKEIKKMKRKEMIKLIGKFELKVDADDTDYEEDDDLAKAIIDEMDL